VTGDELERALADASVTLLDVRSRAEYDGDAGYGCDPRQGHIDGAVHVDVSELLDADPAAVPALLAERGADASRPIVAYCHSGQRSAYAAAALRAAGLSADNYEGSWHEWSRREGGQA
jgi:thiosulfate/3-mercaptopyruvate sulfurtransferase